jgi:hypothetical protein
MNTDTSMIACEGTYLPLAKDIYRKHIPVGDLRTRILKGLKPTATFQQKNELVGFACRAVADDFEADRLYILEELLDEVGL